MRRASVQRVIDLALELLYDRAFRSTTHRIDTLEVRLALAALWLILRERKGLTAYWERAQLGATKPWDNCHEPLYAIKHALREEGWHAPPEPGPYSSR